MTAKEVKYMVESDITMRAVDKPFDRREPLGIFATKDEAYDFVWNYLNDTRKLHTYFSRSNICPREQLDECIEENKMVALNVVLGQFEDMIYIKVTQ
jgi:hypothetical protein